MASSFVLAALALIAGTAAMYFAASENQLGAIVALALSLFWGTVWAALLALWSSNARRIRVEMQERVVERALDYLLRQAERTPNEGNEEGSDWAGLVDRVHGLASKALEDPTRRI